MRDHIAKFEHGPGGYRVFCSCRRWADLQVREHRWQSEDEHAKHVRQVARARAGLARGGTLRTEVRWYREQAQNTSLPKREREMWSLLADELEPRIAPVRGDQDTLF